MVGTIILVVLVALASFAAYEWWHERKAHRAARRESGTASGAGSNKNEEKAPQAPEPDEAERPLVDSGALSVPDNCLVLDIENAVVEVRHSDAATAVSYSTNFPDSFEAAGDTIRQKTFRKGVFVNGTVVIDGDDVSVTGTGFRGLITRAVRKLQPERLVVTVPASYPGGLHLIARRSTSVDVDYWNHRDVTVETDSGSAIDIGDLDVNNLNVSHTDYGEVTLGNIKADTVTFTLDNSGGIKCGNIECEGLCTFNLNDDGDVNAGNISANTLEITQGDDGNLYCADIKTARGFTLTLNGDGAADIDNVDVSFLRVNINDDGGVEMKMLKGGSLTFRQQEYGALTLGAVDAGSIDAEVGGDGDFTVRGDVNLHGDCKVVLLADGNVYLQNVTAGSVEIDIQDDGGVEGEKIEAPEGAVVFKQQEYGAITFASVHAASFTATVDGDGALTVNSSTRATGTIKVTSNGDGDTYLEEVECDELALECNDDGGIEISGGSANRGSATKNDYGDISLRGNFRNVARHFDDE